MLSMDDTHLYQRIAETMRQQILSGALGPGDRLPSVREMSAQWGCTTGTAQRAYQELARQGLVTMRAGQGTRVVEGLRLESETPLRRATLIHRAEAFLLEVLTGGYSLEEIEQAVRHAMDRWRTVEQEKQPAEKGVLRFAGSHDLAVAWLAGFFPEIAPGTTLELHFTGSLGGLIALAEGRADLAGCHLWDEETGTYNAPFVRRLLPGQRVALICLADRKLGLILPEGNPRGIKSLEHIAVSQVKFINRQSGSGTRVWLDMALRKAGISPRAIRGYESEKSTHSAVAQAIAEGQAEAGLGLEAAAISYGLAFVQLASERYDLALPEATMKMSAAQSLAAWLGEQPARERIEKLGGYDTTDTGKLRWLEG